MSLPTTLEYYDPQVKALENLRLGLLFQFNRIHNFIFSDRFCSGREEDFNFYEYEVSLLRANLLTTGSLVGAEPPSSEVVPQAAQMPQASNEWRYIATIGIALAFVALAYGRIIDTGMTFLGILIAILGLSGPELIRELMRHMPQIGAKPKAPQTFEEWIDERVNTAMRKPAAAFQFLGPYMPPLTVTWRKQLRVEIPALLAQVMGVVNRAIDEQIRFLNIQVQEVTRPAPTIRRAIRPAAPIQQAGVG